MRKPKVLRLPGIEPTPCGITRRYGVYVPTLHNSVTMSSARRNKLKYMLILMPCCLSPTTSSHYQFQSKITRSLNPCSRTYESTNARSSAGIS